MYRFFVLAVLVGCGRLGFDEKRGSGAPIEAGGSGSGSSAGDGGGPADGPAAGCVYLASCLAPAVSCCTNGMTTCTPAGACSGTVIPCDVNPPYAPCAQTQGCCLAADGGLACIGPPAPC